MKKTLFHKLKMNKAYTLVEMMIVIAITVILLGISIVGISSLIVHLKMTELDEHAKTIYLEAQDQLGVIEAEGALDAYYESIRAAYPVEDQPMSKLRFLREIYPNGEYVSDYPKDDPMATKMWQNMCYLTRDDELSAKLISHTSDIYNNGGSYLIEFNPKTGDIYGVFYWESDEEISYGTDILGKSRTRADRTDARIGYYGGAIAGVFTEDSYKFDQKTTLINGEELYVKISFAKTEDFIAIDNDTLRFEVKVEDNEGNEVIIAPENTVVSRVDATERVEFYILLDSMYDGYRFNDIVNNGQAPENQTITPGEDISVTVITKYLLDSGYEEQIETFVEGNSLFGKDTNEETICISALRHMLNMNDLFYDATQFADRTKIQYLSDVDFEEEAYSWEFNAESKLVYKGYGKAKRPVDDITPIKNDALFVNHGIADGLKLTGKFSDVKYVLHNFVVIPAGGQTENVGIFEEFHNVDVSNIYVENVTVNAADCDNVGGLAGYMQDGSIKGCGVYLATSGLVDDVRTDYCMMSDTVDGCVHLDEMEHRYETFKITGENKVGGLVGYIEGNYDVSIENVFAAIKVEGTGSYIGGLVGYVQIAPTAMGVTIEHTYTSGDVSGQNYVGGFAGGIIGVDGPSYKVYVRDAYATGNVSAVQKFAGFVGQSNYVAYSTCTSYGKIQKFSAISGDAVALVNEDIVGGFVCDNPETNVGSSYVGCAYMTQIGYNKSEALKNPAGVEKKDYTDLLSTSEETSVNVSYPYASELYLQAFPYVKLANQNSHYGNWPKRFIIDTSLVYYERYEDNSYGYYCVTTVENDENIWLLDTLKDETCVEDGYGLLTKYNLGSISYDLYIGNRAEDSEGNSVIKHGTGNVLLREEVTIGDPSIQGSFLRLNQQGTLQFREIASYDAEYGVEGTETGDTFDVTGLYLYQLPYELQCTDRKGVEYFYDRIIFNATGYGSNKQVIKDLAYLYCPHFAKTAFNPNITGEVINLDTVVLPNGEKEYPVAKPANVFVRSARQLNALGRFSYYWNTRHGLEDEVNYFQETDINFSTYVKEYGGYEFDLQAFDKSYSNRPIGDSEKSVAGETEYAGAFKNNYDGQGYKIIDYCLSVSDVQFVGLFGEIQEATLKNIIMVKSSNPASENAGMITSDFKTWISYGDTTRRREFRASVGALLGMAYDNSYCDVKSNEISNCMASGYTVQYVMNSDDNPLMYTKPGAEQLDPLGVVLGGLIGYGESHISNCAAVNDIVLVMEKDYTNSFDYYYHSVLGTYHLKDDPDDEIYGGIVNMGGFVGSYIYNKIENCYSGGTISIIDNGYKLPNLRVGNFCAGWLDTRAYGLAYTDYQKDGAKYNKSCSTCYNGLWQTDVCKNEHEKCNQLGTDFKSYEYVNCYTYTTVSESVWDVDTDSTNYVPFASNKVDYFDRGTLYGEWDIAQVIPIEHTTYENAYYLSELIDFDRTTEEYADKGTALTHEQLIEKTTINAAYTYAYAYEDANGRYPYQAVVTDHEGNYVHYGDWPTMIDASIVYYEKYADGSFGYYGVVTGINGKESWVLDTLRDRICIEDGYGLLSKYQLDRVNYILDPGNDGEDVESLKSYVLDLISAQQNIRYKKYESYNEIIGEAQGETGISIGMGTGYLYQLPYDLQFTERTSSFYDRIVFSAAADGKTVINYLACMYNPHFAKAAITSVDGKEYHEPTSIFVRSARQLNALGRNPYYWTMTGGSDLSQKVSFIQETDINFSTYAGADKMYCGKDFDLQDFTKEYRNTPIGEPAGRQFKNAYDGRSNAIIDYCVSASDKQFVGLFGEITGATLKNIVMLVSSNPSGDGGKIISSYQVKESTTTARAQRTGVGALVGLAYEEKPMQRSKTQIQNCAVSGYTVQYVLESDVIVNNPFGVAIGGLVGFSMSDISDSSATNNVVMKLERNYDNTFAKDKKGLVYMGGFVGSHMYNTIENCYSGGRISVDNKNGNSTYSIPYLRIGGFCPGWLDTNAGSSKNYTHYKANTSLERKVTYTNIYSYTKVADSVWDIPTGTDGNKFTQYIPLVSNLVEYCSMESREWKTESIADTHISFANDKNVYLEELTFSHMEKVNALATAENDPRKYYMNTETGVSFTATEKTTAELQQLAEAEGKHQVTIMPGHTHTYLYGDMNVNEDLIPSEVAYPYPAVICKVDEAGNKTDVYSHYGDWYSPIETLLVYYEKYEDGFGGYTYGYYSVVNDSVGNKIWVLNTLKDKACVEDGYAILTKYELDNISYDMYQGQGSLVTDSGSGMFDMIHTQEGFAFESYEGYDALFAKPQVQTDDSILVGKMYLYQLPFALQNTNRTNGTKFYDLLVLSATEDGETVIDGLSSWYNPHFAKTAINASKDITYSDPTMIYVRSARQLNLLGRYQYYWNGNYGLAGGAKVTYIQETDINFSTYVKEYAGNADYDLQAFGEPYSNHAIGESYGIPFSNIYDGRSNKIVDYCLDGGEDTHFTGLFGEIKNATLKNIVMVVSSNPEHKNAGLITSSFRTQHYKLSSPNKTKRESRAGLGALLGMANIDAGYNTIENCAASGYTVKFVLKDGNYQSLDTTLVDGRGDILDPLGIAVGGLIGYSTDDISNCAAVNDVVIELKKDYQNTYDNYINRAGYNKGDYGTGGVVYLGGFIGSFYYGKIENCYSGGTIDVINNGYSIPRLRVGGFCPGWVDTPMCGYWFRHFDVEYENIYSYTKVSERVWGVPGKKEWDKTNKVFTNNYSYTFTHYIPLVSRLVDYYEIGTGNAEYWLHDEVLADNNVTFNNNFYLDVVTDVHLNKVGALGEDGTKIQSLYTDAATSIDGLALKQYAKEVGKNVTVVGSNTHTYPAGDFDSVGNLITSEKAYPYPAVIYEVDEDGNPTDTKVHYGDWVTEAFYESTLVYYEKYEDGSYGYYSVGKYSNSNKTWILDTLKNQACVEDGYGILTRHELDTLTYQKWPTTNYVDSPLDKCEAEDVLTFNDYESYDDILGKGVGSLGGSYSVTNLCEYLYKIPYELLYPETPENPERPSNSAFYDRVKFTATADGETVINEALYWFNPHFAKTALNLTESGYNALRRPTNIYVRSARHLNALGRNSYYWKLTGGADGKQKVTFVQETDINFSTYTKTYAGNNVDFQKFDDFYSNRPIGEAVYSDVRHGRLDEAQKVAKHFSNIYDGRSNRIIDYCVDGGTEKQYVGLFGAISDATLKNIVMVVSSNPAGKGGNIISQFETQHIWDNYVNFDSAGVGALVGLAYERTDAKNTIENCATSGYTVKYELIVRNDLVQDIGPAIDQNKPMEPLGVAIGGLVGISTSEISNCTAVNDVEIELYKNYVHTHDNYLRHENYYGGFAYLGGFAGSHTNGKVENCYSGGTIDVIHNGYSIPSLRVGGFCPGWMDVPINGARYQGDYNAITYSNIYTYTSVSKNVWDVPGKIDWIPNTSTPEEDDGAFAGSTDKKFTHLIPLVSTLVDYHDETTYGVDNEFWVPNQTIPAGKITFANNYYLEEVMTEHLSKTDNEIKAFYTNAAGSLSYEGLTNLAVSKDAVVDRTHTFTHGDWDAAGNLIPSSQAYPYPAVIKDVETGDYVHYGTWAAVTDSSPITRYPVYFEEHKDDYGFWYVDENGEVHSNLATVNTTPILNAGYGYLTIFKDEANVPDASIEIENARNQKMTYYLYKMDDAALNTAFVDSGCQANRYMTFNMEYTRGEVILGPDVELTAGTQTLCFNPYYGAALCAYDSNDNTKNLGTTTNPLQVRTKEQFENLRYTTKSAYIKQTHDVDLKNSNTPTIVNSSVLFDGSFSDEGCVIKNAGDTLFESNSGEIRNVRVVSFDSTQSSKDVIAGFVLQNKGVINDCSIAGRTAEEQVIIQGAKAYGFAVQNTNLIENCSVAATVNATSEAVGFVDINTGRVINCTVTDTVIEAAEAFGFAEKNQGGGTITDCTATVRIEASNKAAGFIEQNESTLVNSSVYLADSNTEVAINARKAHGFAEVNSGTITNCRVLAVGKGSIVSAENSNGFVEDNYGSISNCYVGDRNNAEALLLKSSGTNPDSPGATYGFVDRNNKHATITNCYVVAHLIAEEEAAGFVDLNLGMITNSKAGDKDSDVQTIIEAGDAFGFAEKNLQKGETEGADADLGEAEIHQCVSFAKIKSSYKAVGFIEENQNTVTGSTVYLKDRDTDVAIDGDESNGFAENNAATISGCKVISLGKATIVGITEANGFARENNGSISDCSTVANLMATNTEYGEACGFVRYHKGTITNCHVGDKANADMMSIKGMHSYGFAKESGEEDANNSSVKIENCSVVANLTTSREYFAWNNSDASYGFVGTNWGLVKDCQVGDDTDTEGKVEILIQGSRAYGFIRKNRGTITGCSVVGTGKTSIIATATPNATGNLADGDPDRGMAIGFVAENFGIVENSNVSAMNGYDTILIQGEQAVGFIHRNREVTASITGCNVVATVEGELFAAGFVLSNSGKITNCSVEGEIIAADIAAGFVKTNRDSIDNCHVYTELVQGRLAYGFARQNGVEEATATIQNSDVHAKNDYSDIIIRGSERAYGFIGTNWGTVKYCFAVATVEGEITAAGFVAVNENTINNCYANAIVSVSSTNTEAYAGGFARLNNGTIKNSYACGTLTGYTTYGFTNSLGTVTSCYTIVDQDGTNMYGFSASGTPSGCYWGYEGYFNYNAKVARAEYIAGGNKESKITGHKLSVFDDAAEDSVAYPFSDDLMNDKYPYTTFGLTHYGDWPLPAHFHQDVNAEDLTRAGLYYGEEYQDAVTGEWYRGVYAEGDYYYKTKNVRVIGQTINTLMKGDPEDVRKAYNYRCYYGVYYNVDIAAPDWKVNWKFVENGVESAVGTPSPNGIFKNLTEGYVPPNYDTYKFCELKDITDAVLNGTDVKAMATIFYKTNTYGGAHTDTNYNYGKFYYEDETKIDATNGVTLTITLEEVEAARKQ